MKKLLFYLTRYPGVGGIESVTSDMVDYFTSHSMYECDIISHRQEAGIQVCQPLKMPDSNSWCSNKNKEFLFNLLNSGSYDAIIYQDSYAPTDKMVIDACHKCSVPLIVFEHNAPVRKFGKVKNIWDFLINMRFVLANFKYFKRRIHLIEAAHKYVLLTDSFITDIINFGNIALPENVMAVSNPYKFREGAYDPEAKENIILFVGQMNKTKQVDKMIEVWSEVSSILTDWRFVLVGDGPERIALKKKAIGLERIEFVGFSNPEDYYRKAKIFLMMSKFEGSPMTLVECQNYGVNVIAYDSFSAIRELTDDGKIGIIIKNGDKKTFIKELIDLAKDTKRQMELGEKSYEYVKKFDLSNIAKIWDSEILNQI